MNKCSKMFFLVFVTSFFVLGFTTMVDASPLSSESHVHKLNKELEKMVEDVNAQLEQGETEASSTAIVDGEEYELIFSTDIIDNEVSIMSTRSASYRGVLRNRASTGFPFSHTLNAYWSYNSRTAKMISAEATSSLTGGAYAASESTRTTRQTDSVYNVFSTGQFRGLKIGFTYYTNWHVRINATGSYQVITANVSF